MKTRTAARRPMARKLLCVPGRYHKHCESALLDSLTAPPAIPDAGAAPQPQQQAGGAAFSALLGRLDQAETKIKGGSTSNVSPPGAEPAASPDAKLKPDLSTQVHAQHTWIGSTPAGRAEAAASSNRTAPPPSATSTTTEISSFVSDKLADTRSPSLAEQAGAVILPTPLPEPSPKPPLPAPPFRVGAPLPPTAPIRPKIALPTRAAPAIAQASPTAQAIVALAPSAIPALPQPNAAPLQTRSGVPAASPRISEPSPPSTIELLQVPKGVARPAIREVFTSPTLATSAAALIPASTPAKAPAVSLSASATNPANVGSDAAPPPDAASGGRPASPVEPLTTDRLSSVAKISPPAFSATPHPIVTTPLAREPSPLKQPNVKISKPQAISPPTPAVAQVLPPRPPPVRNATSPEDAAQPKANPASQQADVAPTPGAAAAAPHAETIEASLVSAGALAAPSYTPASTPQALPPARETPPPAPSAAVSQTAVNSHEATPPPVARTSVATEANHPAPAPAIAALPPDATLPATQTQPSAATSVTRSAPRTLRTAASTLAPQSVSAADGAPAAPPENVTVPAAPQARVAAYPDQTPVPHTGTAKNTSIAGRPAEPTAALPASSGAAGRIPNAPLPAAAPSLPEGPEKPPGAKASDLTVAAANPSSAANAFSQLFASQPVPGPTLVPTPPTPAATPAPPDTSPAPAVQIANAAGSIVIDNHGAGGVSVHLQPAELGAVSIRVARANDGSASVAVTAERGATLQALQADLGHLHQALDRAGVSENRSVTMHLATFSDTTGEQGGRRDNSTSNQASQGHANTGPGSGGGGTGSNPHQGYPSSQHGRGSTPVSNQYGAIPDNTSLQPVARFGHTGIDRTGIDSVDITA